MENELKGILCWDKESSKNDTFFDGRSKRFETFYEFPSEVKIDTGTVGEYETGYALFKSEETRKREKDKAGGKITLKGEEDESFEYDMFAPPCLFVNSITGEAKDFPLLWIRTVIDEKMVFLYEDFFSDKGKATFPDGTEKEFCYIPFSEDSPLFHCDENDQYDVKDINKWPFYWIDEDRIITKLEDAK